MDMKQLKAKLIKWQESKTIKIDGQDTERRIFKSDEVFKLFGEMDSGVLTPFNDYTYEWLHSFFCNLSSFIDMEEPKTVEDLENFRTSMYEYVDSEVDVYDGQLTDWLRHSNDNIHYLNESAKEQPENVLMYAQYLAIEEVFSGAFQIIMEMVEDGD